MAHILVLGGGMVGSAIAIDLAAQHEVTLSDLNGDRLLHVQGRCPALKIKELDVSDQGALAQTVKPFDLVICAVPGFLGFQTLRSLIEAGKNVVDISFFPENALDLIDLARDKGVTAIVDCGVAPGMDNILLGRYNELMTITDFECLVGGLPKIRTWPFNYKAPFSPIDVIEEYTRPARYVEQGQTIVREPLTDCEYLDFGKAGTLESFNTDGLRSLIFTMSHIPNMKEKTLRYPGHAEYIRVLRDAGFFETEPLTIGDTRISPRAFTSRLLFDAWKLGEEEEEITVMRVTMQGTETNGRRVKVVYDLFDEYDPRTRTSSMARTTGYTATAVASMLLSGGFSAKGVFPPEWIGKHEHCFDHILSYLKDRNIHYHKTVTEL